MSQVCKTKSRFLELDIAKAIGIIAVVVGHCIQCGNGQEYYNSLFFFDNIGYKFIYSFHMPLLMLISGYLFAFSVKKRKLSTIIIRRILQIIIPIFIWNFLISFRHIFSVALVDIIKEWTISSINSFWFLWSVFFASLYVAFVYKKCSNNKLFYIISIFVTFVTPDIFNSECHKFMYVFFVIGFCANVCNWKEKIENIKSIIVIGIMLIYGLLLAFYSRECYIYVSGWQIFRDTVKDSLHVLFIDIYRVILGLFGCSLILWISNKVSEKFKDTFIMNMLKQIGKMTLGIYIVSTYINIVLLKATKAFEYNSLIVIIESIAILLISAIIVFVIRKIKIVDRLLLGEGISYGK